MSPQHTVTHYMFNCLLLLSVHEAIPHYQVPSHPTPLIVLLGISKDMFYFIQRACSYTFMMDRESVSNALSMSNDKS